MSQVRSRRDESILPLERRPLGRLAQKALFLSHTLRERKIPFAGTQTLNAKSVSQSCTPRERERERERETRGWFAAPLSILLLFSLGILDSTPNKGACKTADCSTMSAFSACARVSPSLKKIPPKHRPQKRYTRHEDLDALRHLARHLRIRAYRNNWRAYLSSVSFECIFRSIFRVSVSFDSMWSKSEIWEFE